jgi:hypothetical protein
LVIVHTLIAVIQAILRSAATALLLLFATMVASFAVVAIAAFALFGLGSTVGLQLLRRNRRRPK